MAKRKNSKKRKYNKVENIKDKIVQELNPEATRDTVDMEPAEVIAEAPKTEVTDFTLVMDPAKGDEIVEAAEATESPAEVTDFTLVMDPAKDDEIVEAAEVSESVEPVEVIEAAEAIDAVEDTKVIEPVEAIEVKDAAADTVVLEAAEVNSQTASEPATSAAEAEYIKARAQGPAASTEITPIIPVTGYGDPQNKKARGRNAKAGNFRAAASSAGKFKGVFDKPVTRKFLAAALGLTLVLNGAIAAGIMSLYSHGIKKDVSAVKQTVSELEERSGNHDNFGDPGMGMTPPDWNNGGNDSWNNGGGDSWDNGNGYGGNENGYYGDDGYYNDNWNEDWDDDDWDDDWNNQTAPSYGGEQS